MTLLDSQGRDTEVLHKARCLGAWFRDERLSRVIRQRIKLDIDTLGFVLGSYGRAGEAADRLNEAMIGMALTRILSDRIVRRAIAAHLVKTQGIKRGDAMEALRRMGE